ncbi:MAG: hypothetical protein H8D56_22260 [Planctomycetes bacterium]|nr:hypothetical protein [Planctomycetota bacterium]
MARQRSRAGRFVIPVSTLCRGICSEIYITSLQRTTPRRTTRPLSGLKG